MSKPRSRTTDFAVYMLVRIFVCVLQALSFAAACRLAGFLAWLAYHIDRRHREVAKDNLRKAFPAKHSEAEIDSLVRDVYRHFCRVLMEIGHLPRRLHVSNWK